MFKTIDNPETRDEFLVLRDRLMTDQRTLEKCWDIAKIWCMERNIDDKAKITAVAVRIWARPDENEIGQVYGHIWSDAERFDMKLDDYGWAGMQFGKLAENGFNFNREARDFIEKMVHVENLAQVGSLVEVPEQAIEQEPSLQ